MLSKPFASLALAGTLTFAGPALAWESTGHRIIGELAVQSLAADLPAFLKTPQAIWQIGELSREPDRSRGAGQPHDEDLDPGHFIDLTDDGHVLAGPMITEMPLSRDAYSAGLHASGSDLHKSGWLFYNLIDGYEQLVKDFAYYRADRVGIERSADPIEKQWYASDLSLRQMIIIRDLGYWSHFVGDASQPMHASVHYNGWGAYPNPNGYTEDHIHAPFEGAFVTANVTLKAVKAALPAPRACTAPMEQCVAEDLLATRAKIEPLYALWLQNGFGAGDPRGVAFAVQCIADGAARLRDYVDRAWRESAEARVGYPGVKISAVEAGAPLPFQAMYGDPDGML